MESMQHRSMLLLVACGLLLAGKSPEGGRGSALANLDGAWVVKSIDRDPPEKNKDEGKGIRCVVDDGKVTIFLPGENKPAGRLTIKVDRTTKPMTMTIKPDGEQESLPAIYELDGDKLKVCWASLEKKQAPTDFSTKPGSGQSAVILERSGR
jgi:uncharacterized protein (TIGR03067 family)